MNNIKKTNFELSVQIRSPIRDEHYSTARDEHYSKKSKLFCYIRETTIFDNNCFHIGTSYLFQFGLRSKGTPAAFGHEEKKNLT